jgi:peptidyl-prolyl cis-trans isomerase SurA
MSVRFFSLFSTRCFLLATGLAATFGLAVSAAANDNLDLRFANGIAAIVENKVITIDDIRREIGPYIPQIQKEARNQQEFEQRLEAMQDSAIQNLIDKVLIVKEFYKTKEGEEMKRIPASYVDNAVAENLISDFEGDRSKFYAYLRSRGMTLRDYRVEVEEEIIYSYMRSQQRRSLSIISPVKVEQYYNENKDRFYQEDEAYMRMMQFTRAQGETDDQLRTRAEAALARLKSGEAFDVVAREVSQDARRTRGGDWGWQQRSNLKKEFSEALFALEKGQTTDAIILPEGAYLLHVEDRRYAGIQPIDQAREQIERILLQNMSRSAEERWLERLRRNGYVKLY